MKKLATAVILFILIFPSVAHAKRPELSSLRPDLASIPDKKFTLSIPLVPYFGLTSMMDVGKLRDYIGIYQTMGPVPGNGNAWLAYHIVSSINRLNGKGMSIKGFVIPSLNLCYSTKYLEFSISGVMSTYVSASVKGVKKFLDIYDITIESNQGPRLSFGSQEILAYKSGRMFGFDMWAVSKYPFKLKGLDFTFLVGGGFTFGHKFQHVYRLFSLGDVSMDGGLYYMIDMQSAWVADIGALTGFQIDIPNKLNLRFVLQSTNLVSEHPSFDVGVSANIYNILTVSAELRDFEEPSVLLEISRTWGVNSEAALGMITNSHINSRTFGYASFLFGSKIIKGTITATFNDKQFGLIVGTTIGYFP